MIIENVHLQNYCQWQDLTVDLCPGLNVIVGRIGCGKSNILKAIRFAFTNSSGNPGKREDDITYSLAGSVKSSVTVNALHNSERFILTRFIQPSKRSLKWQNSEQAITSEKGVAEDLQLRLGVDPVLFDEFIVVNQGQIAAIVDMDPADRVEAMQKLVGLSKFAKRYTWLGNYATQFIVPEVLDSEEAIQKSIDTIKADIKSQELEMMNLSNSLSDNYSSAKQMVEQASAYYAAKDSLAAAVKAESDYLSLPSAASSHQHAVETLNSSKLQYQALESRRLAYTEESAKIQSRQSWMTVVNTLEGLKSKLILPVVPEWALASDKLQASFIPGLIENEQRLGVLKHLQQVKLKNPNGVCPTCFQAFAGSSFDDLVNLEQVEAFVKAERHRLQESVSFWSKYSSAVAEAEKAKAAIPQWEAALKTYPADVESYPVAATISFNVNDANLYRSLEKSIPVDEKAVETALLNKQNEEKEILKLKTQRELLEKQFTQMTPVDSIAYSAAVQLVNTHKDNLKKIASCQGQLTVLSKQLKSEEDRLVALKEKIAGLASLRDYKTSVASARNIFHQDNMPAALAKEALFAVAVQMNEVLEAFGASYRVVATEKGTFSAKFFEHASKGIQPDSRLSGGEKAQFGLALRVASQTMWAQELGFLALDEPTYGFGQTDMKCVEIAIEQLRKLSVEQGLQVIVITHEKSLLPLFDKVIQLD